MRPAARAATRSSRSSSSSAWTGGHAHGVVDGQGRRAVARAADARHVATSRSIAPNLKTRLSGVTSTIVQLVPVQAAHDRHRHARARPAGSPAEDALAAAAGAAGAARLGGRCAHLACPAQCRDGGGPAAAATCCACRCGCSSPPPRNARHRPFTKWLIRRMDAVIATSARSGALPRRAAHRRHARHRSRPVSSRRGTATTRFAASAGLAGRHRDRLLRPRPAPEGHRPLRRCDDRPAAAAIPTGPRSSPAASRRTSGLRRRICKARSRAAGLADRILFLGEVPDIKPWYRRLSLYVAPSRNEGFGLTPLEAMASGAAVVASDAGAYAEMIEPGEDGRRRRRPATARRSPPPSAPISPTRPWPSCTAAGACPCHAKLSLVA